MQRSQCNGIFQDDLLDEAAFEHQDDALVEWEEEVTASGVAAQPVSLYDVLKAARAAKPAARYTLSVSHGPKAVVLDDKGQRVALNKPRANPRVSLPAEPAPSVATIVQTLVQHLQCSQCKTNQYVTTDDLTCQQCRFQIQCTHCRNADYLSLAGDAHNAEWFWICLQCNNSPVIPNVTPRLECISCSHDSFQRDQATGILLCVACRPGSATRCHQCKAVMRQMTSIAPELICDQCDLVYAGNSEIVTDERSVTREFEPEHTVTWYGKRKKLTSSGSRVRKMLAPSIQTITLHRNLQRMTQLCQAMFHRLAHQIPEQRRAPVVQCVTQIVLQSQKLHSHRIEADTAAALLQVLSRESPPVSEKVFRATWGSVGVTIRGTKSAVTTCKRLFQAYRQGLIDYNQYSEYVNSLEVLKVSKAGEQRSLQRELTRKIRKVKPATMVLLQHVQQSPWVQILDLTMQHATSDLQLKKYLYSYDPSHWKVYLSRLRWQVQLLHYACHDGNSGKWLADGIQHGYVYEIAAYCYFVSYQALLSISRTVLPGRSRKFTGKCYQRLQIRREPFYMLWQWARQNKAELPYRLGFTRHQRLLSLLESHPLE
jgi:hypothetical protein